MYHKGLIVCSNPPYPAGDGGRTAIRHDILNITKHNPHIIWDVIVLWSEDFLATARWLEKQDLIHNYWVFDKPLFNPLRLLHSYPEHISRFVSLSVIREVARIFCKNQYDVVILNGIYSGFLALALNKYKSLLIYRPHNIEHLLWQQFIGLDVAFASQVPLSFYALNEATKYRKLEMAIWQNVHKVWTIGYHDTMVIRQVNPNTEWLPPILERNFSSLNHTKEFDRSALLLTSYQWLPNKHGLMVWLKRIFPKISESLKDWKFMIGGKGTELVSRYSSGNLKIVGWVNNPYALFKKFSVFFVPVWVSSGIRIKIIEAIMHEMIVVSTFAGIKGLPLKKWVHYIPVDDTPQSWLQAFKWIQENPEEAMQIASNSKQFFEGILRETAKPIIEL